MSLCVSDDCLRRKIWFYQLSTVMAINIMAKFTEFLTVRADLFFIGFTQKKRLVVFCPVTLSDQSSCMDTALLSILSLCNLS